MTETEWLNCTDPTPMLEHLRGKASDRKLRLFAAGCYRRIWHLLHTQSRRAVEGAERQADKQSEQREVEQVRWSLLSDWCFATEQVLSYADSYDAASSASRFTAGQGPDLMLGIIPTRGIVYARPTELPAQVVRLSDLIGNPFRPVSVNTAWLTPTVSNLATAAYEERTLPSGELDTARLAVLADALEEAGCSNTDLLSHLRRPGPHVRGCWAVDAVLAKQ
jgi:hypothetical protein